MKHSRLKSLAAATTLALPLAAPVLAATGVTMQDVATPYGMQSINAYADAYTTHDGVTSFTPAPNLSQVAPHVAADRGGMQGITPDAMQSFAAGQDRYVVRGGDVERVPGGHAPTLARADTAEPWHARRARDGAARYAMPDATPFAAPPLRELTLPDADGPDSLKGQ